MTDEGMAGIEHVSIEFAGRTVDMTPEELRRSATGDAPAPDLMREMVESVLGKRIVRVTVQGEDLRALIERCLLFTETDPKASEAMQSINIDVSRHWMRGSASDGWTLCVQKIACSAEGEGSFLLHNYDAGRILRSLPKPRKDFALGDVHLDFVQGAADEEPHPFNLTYTYDSRALSYSCETVVGGHFPNVWAILSELRGIEQEIGWFSINPQFLVAVAKAAACAKDQQPLFVRWYVFGPDQPVMARFSVVPEHDEFVAALMPVQAAWDESDEVARVYDRLRDLSQESERLQPPAPELPF